MVARSSPSVAPASPATPSAAATPATASAARALLRLVDAQRSAAELLAVHAGNRRLGLGRAAHLDESEPARLAGVRIGNDFDFHHSATVLLERSAQGILGGLIREVSDVQPSSGHDESFLDGALS